MAAIQQLLASLASASGFSPFSAEYTTPGTQTVSIPAGATAVTIECIGGGAGAFWNSGTIRAGGGGGAYSKTNSYSVSGLSALYLGVPASADSYVSGSLALVKANTSGGAVLCLAMGGSVGTASVGGAGGSSAAGTGDLKYQGGTGYYALSNAPAGGGGAGNSAGAGGNSSSGTGGAAGAGTAPAGNGGSGFSNGANYGGGGGGSTSGLGRGAQGWIKLTWS